MDNLEDFSFKEIINNEKLVNDFITLKRKNFNYQDFIFNTIPNYTFYEGDTYDLLKNTNFKTLNKTFQNLNESNQFEQVTDEYSFFINHPLQSLTFSEQFESSKTKKKIYENCETIEEIINFIGLPYESLFNTNENYFKIKSGKNDTQQADNNLDEFNTYNNKDQWDSSRFTIVVDNIQQLNPDKYKEFIEYSFMKEEITKNSIKLSILGIILNTKNKKLLESFANDSNFLNGLVIWLKKEIKNPSSVLMYLIEVLNYIPLKIFVIQEYQFDKYLNDIIEEKNIEQVTKKNAKELKEFWDKLNQYENENKSYEKTKKPTVIKIKTNQTINKSDLFNKILSDKKTKTTPTSTSTSVSPASASSASSTSSTSTSSSNTNSSTASTPTPIENDKNNTIPNTNNSASKNNTTPNSNNNTNKNNTTHNANNNANKNYTNTFRNKFIIRKASNKMINSSKEFNSKPMYKSPTAFIVGNNTFNNSENTVLNNESMLDNPYLKDPRKRASPSLNTNLNGIYKRFKTGSNDSLNNISYTQTAAKQIVPILKKSSLKKPGAEKKRVTFKPDGTMTQYRIIFHDGRDLMGRSKKNARFN